MNPPAARSIHIEEPHGLRIEVHAQTVEIHNHGAGAAELHALHTQSNTHQHQLKEILMGMKEDFAQGLKDVEEATTAIGARIDKYIADQAAGGMTAEDEAAQLARLQQDAAALKAMGKNPADPVPVPVPT